MKLFQRIKNLFKKEGEISDGFHTFDELYEHRCVLFLELCRVRGDAWWSRYHADGTSAFHPKWCLVGIGTKPGKQISYHVPYELLSTRYHTHIKWISKPEYFDGHTSEEVVRRIKFNSYGDK